jgi:polyhydroxyalkanoate synthase
MVINTADEIAPLASMAPFAQAMPGGAARVIETAGESGVGLQHLAILVGCRAYAHVCRRSCPGSRLMLPPRDYR